LPDNRKPLKYGAFPVCRNYTVRAHLRNPRLAERNRCKDRIQYAGTQQCRIHPCHLHPCHQQGAGTGSGKNGKPAEAGTLTQKSRNRVDNSPPGTFSVKFPVWVKSGSSVSFDTLRGRNGNPIYANGFRFWEHKATIADTDCQNYTVHF